MAVENLIDYDLKVREFPYHQWVAFYSFTGRGMSDSDAFMFATTVQSLDHLRTMLGVPGYELGEVINA